MKTSTSYKGTKIFCKYKSENISEIDYDTATKILTVSFAKGMKYEYYDVPHETFTKLNLAESTGKTFYAIIAKNFKYKKL
jgi:predicted butyrate kinase (DUF1464 family)